MTKIVMLVMTILCTSCATYSPEVVRGTNYHWQQKVNEDLTTCALVIKSLGLKDTESQWFWCLHSMGSTL